MRFWWLVLLAGCKFETSLLPPDAPPLIDEEGREIRMWNFDSASEFGMAGTTATDMTIDPAGSLTPEGYIYGALVARGVQGTKLWTNTDADWSKTTTVTPTTYGLWSGRDIDIAPDQLAFVGITDVAMTSVWFEGELFITPGETFKIAGNDTAFVYVAYDGVTFQKLLHNTSAVFSPPAAGWYPVRIGWADGDASGDIDFEVNPGGGFANLDRARFRATTSALRGMYRSVFYRQVHGGGINARGPVMTVQDTPLHAMTNFNPPLPGSFTTSTTLFDWSARWSGQFYVPAAGEYTLRINSDDGHRVTLGGVTLTANFTRDQKGAFMTDVTAPLVAGWNDLIVDYNHVDGAPAFAAIVQAAPGADAALVGAAIPKDRLRPVEPRADRMLMRSDTNSVTVQDNSSTYAELTTDIAAHPGEVVTFVEITAHVISQSPNQLQFRLTAPNNATSTTGFTIAADPNGGNQYIVSGVSLLGQGVAADGIWKFGISDNSGSGSTGNSTYNELHVTVHTAGGPGQIATASSWSSPVVENMTDVVLIDFVNWSERKPAGTTVAVRVRTCAVPTCADGTWSEPLANGAAPVLPRNKYIQLGVEMTSMGVDEPEVDKINVQYRTAPAK